MNNALLNTVRDNIRMPIIYAACILGLIASSCGKNTNKKLMKEYAENKREFAENNPEKMKKTYFVTNDDFKDNKHEVTGEKTGFELKKQTEPAWEKPLTWYQDEAKRLVPVMTTHKAYNKKDFHNNICLWTQELTTDHYSPLDLGLQRDMFERIIKLDEFEKNHEKEETREQFLECVGALLKRMEGFRNDAYRDTKNLMTVGIGFNMDAGNAHTIWEKAFQDSVSFDKVYNKETDLSDKHVYKLFATCMTTNVIDKKGNPRPSFYEILRNHVRNAGQGKIAMEDIPYAQQLGMLSVIFQSPSLFTDNNDVVYDCIRTWANPKSSEEDIRNAGEKMAELYERRLIINRKNTPNIQKRIDSTRRILTATRTDIYKDGINNQPMSKESFLRNIDHRCKEYGASGCVYINVVGDLPVGFVPDDLQSLKNEGKKEVVLIVPREQMVIIKKPDNKIALHYGATHIETGGNKQSSAPKKNR